MNREAKALHVPAGSYPCKLRLTISSDRSYAEICRGLEVCSMILTVKLVKLDLSRPR
jgi:hypothetical protein